MSIEERGTPAWYDDRLIEASGVAGQELPAGALYVVATPIGNVADVTVRALWVLSHVDAIAAEDTRTTRTLLDRYGISARGLIAAHEHNERAAAARLLELVRVGQRVALVTDAGTPAISDPGAAIVRAMQEAGQRVIPVPGASSVTTLLSAAGLFGSAFTFIGFLPSGVRERARRLQSLAHAGEPFVLLEAPHRMIDTARELAAALDAERRIVIGRELTKKFESIATTTAAALPAWIEANPPRGEYVLLIDALAAPPAPEIDATVLRWLDALADALPPARAAAVAAKATGLPREPLYERLVHKNRPR
ncbi:MAG TPA: 16S rRNA (cytidine(1402)-2'-O)-methyltransferase [Burkholderiaceae bacterium]|nr:16S rRNA (cytidine(1402)-2'-O)-methyltransferase [Burkholderiaceae bacterium]